MLKILLSLFLFFSLSACTASKNFQISGAYFGANIGEEILLTDEFGFFQQHCKLKDGSSFKFEVPAWQAKGRRFYLIYSYKLKPTLNTKSPNIKAILNVSSDLYLPAILVYDLKLNFDGQSDGKLLFSWNKPVFSQSQNSFFEITATTPSKQVLIAKLPYEELSTAVNLSDRLSGSKTTLNELFKQKCKVNWNLKLPYHYPEGLDLLYSSNSVEYNFCKN